MDLTTTDENQVNTCQTSGNGTFTPENISACEKYVRSIQYRLDKAVANDDKPKIRWYTHILSKKSRAVKILAVHRICNINTGRKTAGVDGVSMPTGKAERLPLMERLINKIDINDRPQPIRRVYIPKPNGKQRPLGIPTIQDRITQEIIRQTIEPICEYHFLPCSYGFRPKRSCHDAIGDLFIKLSRKHSRQWVIEGDIKGCFDHIKHDHITSTLREWNVPISLTNIIDKMLKANIMEGLNLTPSTDGTPQGGVISPLLANVALTFLDEEIKDGYEIRGMTPIVRYADDFVILAENKINAVMMKSHIRDILKSKANLELSDEKTDITHISNGFNFLGFNLRKYEDKLLIKPSNENVRLFKQKISGIIRKSKSENINTLIAKLNPIIKGWGNYYRHVVSNGAFHHATGCIVSNMIKWCKRQSPSQWIQRFTMKKDSDRLIFQDKRTGTRLLFMIEIPIRRYIKVRNDVRLYDVNAKEYWEEREYRNAQDSIYGSAVMTKLFRSQRGKCEHCGKSITDEQIKNTTIHKHHMKPRSEGGNWKLSNLRLLHKECHNSLHSMYSRKQMAGFMDNGIDYLRLMKPINL